MGSEGVYIYKVKQIQYIDPVDVQKVTSIGDHNLTLFTCEGFDDKYRLVVKAEKVNTVGYNSSSILR